MASLFPVLYQHRKVPVPPNSRRGIRRPVVMRRPLTTIRAGLRTRAVLRTRHNNHGVRRDRGRVRQARVRRGRGGVWRGRVRRGRVWRGRVRDGRVRWRRVLQRVCDAQVHAQSRQSGWRRECVERKLLRLFEGVHDRWRSGFASVKRLTHLAAHGDRLPIRVSVVYLVSLGRVGIVRTPDAPEPAELAAALTAVLAAALTAAFGAELAAVLAAGSCSASLFAVAHTDVANVNAVTFTFAFSGSKPGLFRNQASSPGLPRVGARRSG